MSAAAEEEATTVTAATKKKAAAVSDATKEKVAAVSAAADGTQLTVAREGRAATVSAEERQQQ